MCLSIKLRVQDPPQALCIVQQIKPSPLPQRDTLSNLVASWRGQWVSKNKRSLRNNTTVFSKLSLGHLIHPLPGLGVSLPLKHTLPPKQPPGENLQAPLIYNTKQDARMDSITFSGVMIYSDLTRLEQHFFPCKLRNVGCLISNVPPNGNSVLSTF